MLHYANWDCPSVHHATHYEERQSEVMTVVRCDAVDRRTVVSSEKQVLIVHKGGILTDCPMCYRIVCFACECMDAHG